jgi:hypothetical protein
MSKETQNQETAVATKTSTEVSALSTDLAAWGESAISSRDIVIPKILAMQGLSDLVTEGKARFGEFVDSVTHEVLGSIEKPIEFVPFHLEKVWIVSERKVGDDKFEFDRYEEVTAENMNRVQLQETIGDREIKYEYAMQFYVILPSDPAMPKVITFKSTSSRAGRVLSTQMFIRNKAAGLIPPAYIMELGGKKEKNEKGTFVVMEVKPKSKTPDNLIGDCLTWMNIIKQGKTQVAPERSSATADANYADENVKF